MPIISVSLGPLICAAFLILDKSVEAELRAERVGRHVGSKDSKFIVWSAAYTR